MSEIDETPRTGDLSSPERIAIVAWHLASGETLTVEQAARLTGLTANGTRRLLSKIARVVPIYDVAGHWRRCP